MLPSVARHAALGLSLMLLAVFPANVHAAREHLPIAGTPVPALIPRALMQIAFQAATTAVFLRALDEMWNCRMQIADSCRLTAAIRNQPSKSAICNDGADGPAHRAAPARLDRCRRRRAAARRIRRAARAAGAGAPPRLGPCALQQRGRDGRRRAPRLQPLHVERAHSRPHGGREWRGRPTVLLSGRGAPRRGQACAFRSCRFRSRRGRATQGRAGSRRLRRAELAGVFVRRCACRADKRSHRTAAADRPGSLMARRAGRFGC